ncbi:MAG: GNAT family N-acetyltransferase [Solirubrobacterales bacterium]|nr:GNAT family N-acetyltransferase [Solirubrobacterales bacterium]
MQLRVARHTERLDEVVAFYRDGLGLPEVGGFRDHDGYDGVFLELPGTGAHLELTSGGGHGAPAPHPESLLVLYLGGEDAVRRAAGRLGADPVAPANPYWAAHALTFEDPDGFRVVLVPARWPAPAVVDVAVHTGPRAELRRLFALAEDSARALDAYLEAGQVLVAREDGRVVGHLQLMETGDPAEAAVNSMAVAPEHQGRGVGRTLLVAAIERAREQGRRRLVVATAAADTGNLRFYQRLGFRLRAVERDAFTEAAGYAPGIAIDGVPLRDRVRLDLDL